MDYGRYRTLSITRRGEPAPCWTSRCAPPTASCRRRGTTATASWPRSGATWPPTTACAAPCCAARAWASRAAATWRWWRRWRTTSTVRTRVWKEARDLVYNVINCDKPIVSAMHGPAVGAGLVAGLLADISIAAQERQDRRRPHPPGRRRRRPCGDRLAAAVRHGQGQVPPAAVRAASAARRPSASAWSRWRSTRPAAARAYEIADRLAAGSQSAIRWTKYSLNNWLRQAGPTFDTSLALEFMGFAGPDVREGVASLRERRAPKFV